MRLKKGARIKGLQPQMLFAIMVADEIYETTYGVELVITSGSDGKHSDRSFHYNGAALDFRTRDLPDDEAKRYVATELQEALGFDFQVILEKDHIHVEWQPLQ